MSRFIFVNKNQYDVFVPTPNGAGRRVKVGEAVEGDYFIDIANTGLLARYVGDPANVNIICEYRLNSYLQASQTALAESKRDSEPADAPVVVPEPVVAVDAPTVEEAPAEVIAAPTAPTALTPSEKDLFALSMDELRMVAATMGIDASPDLKKKTLVKMINANKK